MKLHSVLKSATSTLAVGLAAFSTVAYAQSTGSVDFENSEIVVTGQGLRDVAGVVLPDTTKAKQVLTQEVISTQTPGQSVNDIINLVPGVSFQNNDPYGSAGGSLWIRGFDDTRISQTFDGIPLNDTGGYALYSNQQLDPEVIDQVNVNLGSTDVDSPTAAATGSTVNYRSINPKEEFGAQLIGSAGKFDFTRIFGIVHTGVFTPFGTSAYFTASKADNDAIFGGIGKIDKQQYNFKVYQPVGADGDFVSFAGHWNRNRNNFFGSIPLRLDPNRVVGGSSSNRFPITKDERFYEVNRCLIPQGVSGAADSASSCGSEFEYRFNPSDTGNLRIASLFTLSDKLTLSVDPSIQYVKANGGGTSTAREFGYTNSTVTSPIAGYIGGSPYFNGVDLNGDGDTLDQVRVLSPSQTETWRLGVIASLRYDINDSNRVRIAYSYDRGRHRQTGETGYLQANGFAVDPFPVDDPLVDANGNVLQKRDRLSYAILHQASGEYSGDFMNDTLHLNLGVRLPFFKRNLTNNCLATSGSGFVDCFSTNAADQAAYAAANPNYALPQNRIFKYNKVLPNAGAVFDFTPAASIFANYSKGVQVPGTDNLYQSFFFPLGTDSADPDPETTDNFDLGLRYTTGMIQAQLVGWYTIYSNRLASSYDRDLNITIYRNLGKVDKYGIDGSIAVTPVPQLSLYAFGSYLKSKIKDDVQTGTDASGNPVFAPTAGQREAGAPVYTFGGRATGSIGPVDLGIQAKRTGPRYVNDVNLPIVSGGVEIYPKKTPAYTVVDINARLNLEFIGLNELTYFQFNVTNVFDELYVGSFDGAGTTATSVPFAQVGAPRTFIGTVSFGF
jgi:iron complex outermembrane recepter protein